MNSLHQNLLRQTSEAAALLERLEASPQLTSALAPQLSTTLQTARQSVDDYEASARKEIVMAKREKSLQRVTKLRESIRSYSDRLGRIQAHQDQRVNELQDRQELFQRKSTRSDQPQTVVSIDDYQQREHLALHDTERHIDDFIVNGRTALNNLVEQRTMLKSAHRKMLDAANTLGLSRTLMQYIERRSTQDIWIFWGGVVISISVMWAIVHYLK